MAWFLRSSLAPELTTNKINSMRKGAHAREKIVTNARGGFSNHNFGVAWDIGIFKDGDYIEESKLYKSAGAIGKQQGLEWGGDWESFADEPHFQVVAETELAKIRTFFENGESFVG